MSLGYDGKLFILALDHRGSLKEEMFGITGREATAAEREQLEDAKRLIWEGFQLALAGGARVEHWVRTAAGVPGYAGFAIGRTLWWDGVKGWKEGRLTRAEAAEAIGAA